MKGSSVHTVKALDIQYVMHVKEKPRYRRNVQLLIPRCLYYIVIDYFTVIDRAMHRYGKRNEIHNNFTTEWSWACRQKCSFLICEATVY